MNRKPSPTVLKLAAALLVFVPAASSCGDDTPETTTPTDGTGTAGSEGGGSAGGGGSADDGPRADTGGAGGDVGGGIGDELEGPQVAQPGQPGAGPGQPVPGQPAESPWGSPEADSGTPLPPRHAMNGSAQDLYRQGLAAAAAGNNEAAQQAFQSAVAADPTAYKAVYNLGVLADRSGNENRALDFYRQALRIQADYERAAEGMVTIYLRRNAAPDAIAFIQPLAARWVRNLYLQAICADALVAGNRLEDAVSVARAALRRDERFVPAMISLVKANLRQSRTELAETILDQAIGVDANVAELHFLKGRMLVTQNRLADALQSYERAVQLRPDYAEARMALGIQNLAGGNYTQAVAQFEAVQRLSPGLVAVYLNLGDAYRATKQWNKAKAAFDRAITIQDRLPEAHFNLALMYMTAGAEFPGMDQMQALNRAVTEMNQYRTLMGSRLARDDASQTYLEDLARQIEREQKRIDREKAAAARDAARAARQAQTDAGAAAAPAPAPAAAPAAAQ